MSFTCYEFLFVKGSVSFMFYGPLLVKGSVSFMPWEL